MASYREFRKETLARQRHRSALRVLRLAAAAVVLLGLAWVITWAIETVGGGEEVPPADSSPELGATGLSGSVLAPLPMENPVTDAAGGVQFAAMGPVQQTGDWSYTPLTYDKICLPACGRVDNTWFSTALFLGDSVTEGLGLYENPVKDVATVRGYRGATPGDVVNRVVMTDFNTNEESVPLDVAAEMGPKSIYLMFGANALAARDDEATENSFIAYYGQMIDLVRQAAPAAQIYVQTMTPVAADYESTGIYKERIQRVNEKLAALALEKGVYFVDVYSALADENGDLLAEYSSDGLHMVAAGYKAWAEYLAGHVAYSADNPYVMGSEYYIAS
ncbi:MAG TPA: hypothetical protein H9795_05800 [Candidatus Fournierella merdigallinarum]|nr:hypothetical protein [Candidatus Fournierella merdigallinarum]